MHTLDSNGGGLRAAFGLAIVSIVGFGLIYPAVATLVGGALFPGPARGSLIERGGVVIGSALVAQPVSSDRYFHPRPSAAGYNPMALSGSNWAPSNPALRERAAADSAAVAAREGVPAERIPAELIAASGGGIDPHLSPAAAELQVARVARARGLDPERVRAVVARFTEAPTLGALGQPRVNVVLVNAALDEPAAR
jgi:K+-transporting ATPase ATPase C chain